MIAEEIEIIVTARVEEALREFKKMLPELKKQMKQAQDEFNKVDMKSITTKTQSAIQQVKQKIGELKGSNTDKALQQQFEKASTSVMNYRQQLEQTKEQLRQVYAQMDVKQEKTWKQYTPDGVELGNKGIESTVNQALSKDKEYQNLINQETKLNQKVEELNQKLQQAKQNYKNIGAEVEQTKAKQNIFTTMAGKTNSIFKTIKSQIGDAKSSFNGLPNITAKVTANIKQMSTGMKQGLGHILKYAGALVSLRSIYSTLNSSASSWLSSQNVGAKQLATNIEYMKYSMGSALAPIIQWVTNLIYNLMKAIQSVVYALFKVNIFAKASAKSYASMAGSAKKAKNETKQLAGVHDEINNIQNHDNADSGSGSGSGTPSFDLSHVDPSSSIMDAIANGDWYGVGVLLGEKLNQAMASIDWEKIQNTARQIGTNLALLLNGFIATADWYQVGNTFAQGLNTAIYFAYSFITTFNWKQFGTAIGRSVNGFFSNVDWETAGQTFGEGIKGIFNSVNSFLEEVDWKQVGESIRTFLENIDWKGIWEAVKTTIIDAIGSIDGILTGLFGDENTATIIEGIVGTIMTLITALTLYNAVMTVVGIVTAIATSPITLIVLAIAAVIAIIAMVIAAGYLLINHWETIKENAIALKDEIVEKFTEIKDNIVNKVTEIKDKAVAKFIEMKDAVIEKFTNIKLKAQEIWENIKTTIKEKIDNVKNNISNVLNNIKSTWQNIWGGMKNTVINIWNGIWSGIKGVINSILGGIEGFANGIVRGINKVLSGLDGIVNAVGQVIGIDIHVSPLSEISLPRLAKGNVAYDETLAIFGEYAGASNNPEITTPQNIMADTFRSVLSEFNGNAQSIELTVNVGNEKLGRILLDDLRSIKRQTGKDIEAIVGG